MRDEKLTVNTCPLCAARDKMIDESGNKILALKRERDELLRCAGEAAFYLRQKSGSMVHFSDKEAELLARLDRAIAQTEGGGK